MYFEYFVSDNKASKALNIFTPQQSCYGTYKLCLHRERYNLQHVVAIMYQRGGDSRLGLTPSLYASACYKMYGPAIQQGHHSFIKDPKHTNGHA